MIHDDEPYEWEDTVSSKIMMSIMPGDRISVEAPRGSGKSELATNIFMDCSELYPGKVGIFTLSYNSAEIYHMRHMLVPRKYIFCLDDIKNIYPDFKLIIIDDADLIEDIDFMNFIKHHDAAVVAIGCSAANNYINDKYPWAAYVNDIDTTNYVARHTADSIKQYREKYGSYTISEFDKDMF